MAAYTYEQLRNMTVQQLRDIAKETGHETVQGAMQMNKEHLLPALCTALGIDAHAHHSAAGIDKPALKAKMRDLKQRRDRALEAHDSSDLRSIRRQLHRLNRQIRAHTA